MTEHKHGSEQIPPISTMLSDIHKAVNHLVLSSQKQTQLLEYQHIMYGGPNNQQPLLQLHTTYDPLTGALNYSAFMKRCVADIELARQHQQEIVLGIFDIDQFHDINERYNIEVGDEVLFEVAEIIRNEMLERDVVGRIGADQFAVIWAGEGSAMIQARIEQIINMISSTPMLITPRGKEQAESIRVIIRVGQAVFPEDGITAFELERAARQALQSGHQAKNEREVRRNPLQTQEAVVAIPDPSFRMESTSQANHTRSLGYEDLLGNKTSIQSLTAALEAQNPHNLEHSKYLARLAESTALLLNRPIEEARLVGMGALLHDVGNLGIPPEILNKVEPLTPEEWAFVRKHPYLGERLLSSIGGVLAAVAAIVATHRERWDGSGYPSGMKGHAIPLAARIVAVCAAFGAMISERPYRPALLREEAITELKRHAGTQFDPEVVDAFIQSVLSIS